MKTQIKEQLRQISATLRDIALSLNDGTMSNPEFCKLQEAAEIVYNITIEIPEFYFEWGNEGQGNVTVGYYNPDDEYRCLGHMTRDEAIRKGLRYYCPYK